MSAPQAAAITACTACAAVGGAAAGGAFSSGSTDSLENTDSPVETGENISTQNSEPATPTYTFQAQETTAISETTKIGKKYENYLIGVYGDNNSNENYWKLVYERYKADTAAEGSDSDLSDEFKKTAIDSHFEGSSTTTKKPLNKACETVYKKEYSSTIKTGNDNAKYKKSLWKYCSELGEAPKTISEAQEESHYNNDGEKIGKTKKTVLLALTGTHNQKFWTWKNEEFKKLTSISDSNYFKNVLDKDKESNPKKTLKQACEEAYKKTNHSGDETATEVKDTSVVKYCSLNGEE